MQSAEGSAHSGYDYAKDNTASTYDSALKTAYDNWQVGAQVCGCVAGVVSCDYWVEGSCTVLVKLCGAAVLPACPIFSSCPRSKVSTLRSASVTSPPHIADPCHPQATKDKSGDTWNAARDVFHRNWHSANRNWDDAMSTAWEQWQVGGRHGCRGRDGLGSGMGGEDSFRGKGGK
jgi:hypothetical protein